MSILYGPLRRNHQGPHHYLLLFERQQRSLSHATAHDHHQARFISHPILPTLSCKYIWYPPCPFIPTASTPAIKLGSRLSPQISQLVSWTLQLHDPSAPLCPPSPPALQGSAEQFTVLRSLLHGLQPAPPRMREWRPLPAFSSIWLFSILFPRGGLLLLICGHYTTQKVAAGRKLSPHMIWLLTPSSPAKGPFWDLSARHKAVCAVRCQRNKCPHFRRKIWMLHVCLWGMAVKPDLSRPRKEAGGGNFLCAPRRCIFLLRAHETTRLPF